MIKRSYFIYWVFLLLLIFFRSTPALAIDAKSAYEGAKKKMFELKSSPSKMERRDMWLGVIESFLEVSIDFPNSEKADDALYMVGSLYAELYQKSYNSKDLYRAIESFETLVKSYPKSNLADDALHEVSSIYRKELHDLPKAYCTYLCIIEHYPGGDMKPYAESGVKELASYAPAGGCLKGDKKDKTIEGKPKETTEEKKPVGRAFITGLRYSTGDGTTRIVLDLDRRVDYTFEDVGEGEKENASPDLQIEVLGSTVKSGVTRELTVKDGLVKGIRLEDQATGDVRTVIEFDRNVTYSVFPLASPDRVVIDVKRYEAPAITEKKPKDDNAGTTKVPVSSNIKIIVIDPGHGGRDPGAVGPTKYYEKTANLKIAKNLKKYLEERLKLTVYMTRDSDLYLSLKDRTAFANKHNADLFISVHNNASKSRSPYGISTYYLAITSDERALGVAARENNTTVEKLSELDYILTDLMVSAHRNESSLLSKFVQEGMVNSVKTKYDQIKNIGVCQGPFWVLVGAQMPSILMECSYISNKREELRLKDDEYLTLLSEGIFRGVERYIKEINAAKKNW